MSSNFNQWNEIAEEYSQFIAKDVLRKRLLNGVVLELLGEIKDAKIFDAGCGEGYLSGILSDRGATVVGIDGASEMIKIAKDKYPEENNRRFFVHDLREKLPFNDGEFDIVLSNMVLMDFDPIEDAIKEFHRILKIGGKFIFSIVHPSFISAGQLKRGMLDKLLNRMPHYKINRYHTPFAKKYKIYGLSQETTLHHRPIEYYFDLLNRFSFTVKKLKEPVMAKDWARDKGKAFELTSEIPVFLVIKAEKNQS